MKSVLARVTALVVFFATSDVAQAATSLVTFDDAPPVFCQGLGCSTPEVPSGYASLDWSNFYYSDTVHDVVAPGYVTGTISPANVAFNGYLTAAFNDGLQVQIDGFLGTSLVYSNVFTLVVTQAALIELDYLGVDRVLFASYGGAGSSDTEHFAMDNLSIATTPEPASIVLVGLASFGIACRRASRRTA